MLQGFIEFSCLGTIGYVGFYRAVYGFIGCYKVYRVYGV